MKKIIAIIVTIMISQLVLAADTDTLACDYTIYSDSEGNHSVKGKFKLTFVIDKQKGVAYLVGNQGSAEVSFLPSEMGLSFLEVTGAGNLMTTTVDRDGNSVHSRNTVIAGKLVPSQYYGECIFK